MFFFIHLFRVFRTKDLIYTQKIHVSHLKSAVRRLGFAFGLMMFAVFIGTLGYRIIEHETWFDSYYMSLVTLSTVGYGEVIPLSFEGRVFTSFLIIFNIGFFAYSISTITSIFADSKIHAFFLDFKMMQRIQNLKQHTIVCGFGRHAEEVCQELTKQKVSFVVIEMDHEKTKELRHETNYLFLEGDATNDEVLREAGIEQAASLVVTLPEDANNLFVVLSARQINPNLKIISRLNDSGDEQKLIRAGANHVVMPEKIGGFYMATLVNKPDLVEFFTLISNTGSNQVVFEEIPVSRFKAQFQSCTIAECKITTLTQMPILGLRHADGHYQLNPPLDSVIQRDMDIVILGDIEQINRFKDLILKDSEN
ncbi:MAG: potassium channel family protein [Saprospiraceae bacterium]